MPRLKLVPPDAPAPMDIAQQWRDEIRQKGRAHWGALHVAADKREPVLLAMLRKVHRI